MEMAASNLCFLVILASFGLIKSNIHTDRNCTYQDGVVFKWRDIAFNCENVLSDATCEFFYTPRFAAETPNTFVAGSTSTRPNTCFSYRASETTFNQELQDLAIRQCPKRCGYCCLTPEFRCSNAIYPRLNCNSITRDQCLSPVWRTIIASDCPAACGFCNLGGCVDAIPNCANDVSICMAVGLQDFVNKNCQKTCGRCPSTTSAVVASAVVRCVYALDRSPSCSQWKANGFCTNSFYTQAQKKSYCSKTCQIC